MTDLLYPHQREMAVQALALLRSKGLAYLAGAPRTGKTRASFEVINNLPVKRVMFLTKKQAVPGILSELAEFGCTAEVVVTNYEQITKHNPDRFDFVVIDEAHSLGTVGKPSQRYLQVREFCGRKPVLFMSGTPLIETPLAAYYQMSVCAYSPFRVFEDFYDFFRAWGLPAQIKIGDRWVESYKKAKPTLIEKINRYMVRVDQTAAGIKYQAQDCLHRIEPSPATRDLIQTLLTDAVATLPDGTDLVCETLSALRIATHQLEYGGMSIEGEIHLTGDTSVTDYVRATWGDAPDVAVMCHFKSTRALIERELPKVHLYSSEAHAAGVDLSQYRAFVIVGTGYSGASHTQRRDRTTNLKATTERIVHHLVIKGGISEAVYKKVSEKLNFNVEHLRQYRNARVQDTSKNPHVFEKRPRPVGREDDPVQHQRRA